MKDLWTSWLLLGDAMYISSTKCNLTSTFNSDYLNPNTKEDDLGTYFVKNVAYLGKQTFKISQQQIWESYLPHLYGE